MNIFISVVIIEYHSYLEIKECIASLKAHLSIPYEIIVSSNSCYSEEQKENIDKNEENVRWIFNEANNGFAYALDNGLQIAKGDFILTMNSDCILTSSIDDMIDFMVHHPEIGCIAPQIIDKEGNIQDTARPYVSLPRYIERQIRRILGRKTSILDNKMDYTQIQTVDWVIGAFMIVSRKAYQLTGGLDRRYFMYAEDLDWCTRIRQQGLEIIYYPKTIIIFKGTRRARNSFKFAKIFILSHIKYWLKFGFFYGYPHRKQTTY